MPITANESSFIGVGLELMFYGFYCLLFVLAILCLTWRRRSEAINKFYLFFCCFLFSCCSVHVFIRFRYMFKDLIRSPNPTGALETGTPALRTADTLVTLINFFAEQVLLYRCWVIWQRNYFIIIFPAIVSLASVSCAMSTIGILVSTPTAAIVPPALVPLGTAAFAIPLTFNFMVTILIIGRIWHQGRQRRTTLVNNGAINSHLHNYAKNGIIVVVEAGVLYLVTQFVLVVLFALNHPAQILVSDIAVQVYGIAPTLIFVRVGLNAGSLAGTPLHPSNPSNPESLTLLAHRQTVTALAGGTPTQKSFGNRSQGYSNSEHYELSSFDDPKTSPPLTPPAHVLITRVASTIHDNI